MGFSSDSLIYVIRGQKFIPGHLSDADRQSIGEEFSIEDIVDTEDITEIFSEEIYSTDRFGDEVFNIPHQDELCIIGEIVDKVKCTFSDSLQAFSTIGEELFSVHRLSKMVRMNRNPRGYIFGNPLNWEEIQKITKRFTYTESEYYDRANGSSVVYQSSNRRGLETLYDLIKNKYDRKPQKFDIKNTELGQIIDLSPYVRETNYYLVPSDCACCT